MTTKVSRILEITRPEETPKPVEPKPVTPPQEPVPPKKAPGKGKK
jgi:hypothetical protein